MQTIRKLSNKSQWLLVLLAAIGCCLAHPVFAQQKGPKRSYEQVVRVLGPRTQLDLIEKFSKVVELESKLKLVDGFDPAIVNVSATSPTRIRVQSLSQGVTTIVLTDEADKTYLIEVFVKGDARHLQAIIDSKFPDSSIEAFKVRESVVLSGWVSHPEHITQIVEIAEQFYPRVLNQMQVGGVQQVKLKVKVMEVQRSKIRQMGLNFIYLNRNGYLGSTPGQLTQIASSSLPFKPGTPSLLFNQKTLGDASMAIGVIDDNNIFSGFFEALKQESLLKILAEPEVVTTNGHPASLLSGGEFPILVPQSLGTLSIQWREFGVRLEAVPIILGGGRVRLQLQPEVSERDFTNAVTLSGTTVPGLTTRRVNTQVELKFGQTMMLAGLIANRRTAETNKIPFLGELPWIGAAFRRVKYDDVETEVVIMVTPELVAPLEADQVPAGGPGQFTSTPTDRELYGQGLMEVPKFGPECENCGIGESHRYVPGGLQPIPDSFSPGSNKGQGGRLPPAPATSARSNSRFQGIASRGREREREKNKTAYRSNQRATPRRPAASYGRQVARKTATPTQSIRQVEFEGRQRSRPTTPGRTTAGRTTADSSNNVTASPRETGQPPQNSVQNAYIRPNELGSGARRRLPPGLIEPK